MRPSLDRLRALAARIVDRPTLERVIDPLLADLRMEYADANQRGRVWLRRWTLISGHLVFLKTLAFCVAEAVRKLFGDWSADDGAALKRTLGVAAAAIAVTTAALEVPPLIGRDWSAFIVPEAILFLLPQALVFAVPLGFAVGVFLGLRGRIVSLRSMGAVMACAIGLSFACLALSAQVGPRANQEFRQAVVRQEFGPDHPVPMKGFNELTLAELSERMNSNRRTGIVDRDPRLLAYSYHQRWALSCATVILALFALAMTQRMATGWTAGLGASGTLLLYSAIQWTGRAAMLQLNLPAFVSAWLPNTLFALVGIAVLAATSRRAVRARPVPLSS